jgi:hypothetical protein
VVADTSVKAAAPALKESLLSLHCRGESGRSHRYCRGRALDENRQYWKPCYCTCHFPDATRTWECTHFSGYDLTLAFDRLGRRRPPMTDKMRQQLANMHSAPKRKRGGQRRNPDFPPAERA